MPIKLLPPELAAQIAAGEVVERPMSVVKELVENSIDAKAGRIMVEIKGGGVEQIRVTDDGAGIPAREVSLAFQHHATSKLADQASLEAIGTLGFRGEALPSIAAVSRLTMTTRPAAEDSAHSIQIDWGQPLREGAEGAPPGTSVVVADLFGNMPARRKFLKSANAEAGRIHDLLSRYALAYPETAFRLTAGGRQVLAAPGSGRIADALLAVYGAEVADSMLSVADDGPDADPERRVEGCISAPGLHRANRSYATFLVNRRWIQNRMLSFALEEAYHGLLPERRYPVAVLNLTTPLDEVDVNSHPTKREVRFRDDGKVYAALQRTVRQALVGSSPVRGLRGSGQAAAGFNAAPAQAASPGFFRSPLAAPGNGAGASPAGAAARSGGGQPAGPGPRDADLTPWQALPSLRVVGQVRLTYIVAESPDGLYLVDQHAAHERVLFDRIVRQAGNREVQSQPLLAPAAVELTLSQEATFDAHREALAAYGYQVEHFGDNAYLIRATPAILQTGDPGKALLDVLDLVAFDSLQRQQEDRLAASVACHSAIRAGQSLTEQEMRALLEQLEAADSPHTCPHGRPTLLHFSSYHMEREFGRR